MGQLHELIAVEKNIRATAAKIVNETGETFTGRQSLFCTQSKTWQPINEGDIERPEEEFAKPYTTVHEKLKYFSASIIKLLDVIIQKEKTNARAASNVIPEASTPNVLLEEVPVSALVQIENILEELKTKVFDKIPTLDPAKTWIKNDVAGNGKYITNPVKRQSTKKITKPITLHPGTEKHAPQVQLVNEDVVNGTWDITYFSGMLSPAEKSEILGRLDNLIEAVKKARSRANSIDIVKAGIGSKIFNYIFNGTV